MILVCHFCVKLLLNMPAIEINHINSLKINILIAGNQYTYFILLFKRNLYLYSITTKRMYMSSYSIS